MGLQFGTLIERSSGEQVSLAFVFAFVCDTARLAQANSLSLSDCVRLSGDSLWDRVSLCVS